MWRFCSPVLVPLPPTSIKVIRTIENADNVTVFFEWTSPMGEGSAYAVESYIFSVSSASNADYYAANNISTSSTNTILEYNMDYEVFVTSVNCAGQSEPLSITNIHFGKP